MKKFSNKLYVGIFIVGILLIALSIVPLIMAKNTNRIPGYGVDEFSDTIAIKIVADYIPKGSLQLSLVAKNSLNKTLEGYMFDLNTAKLQTPSTGIYVSYSQDKSKQVSIQDGQIFLNGTELSTNNHEALRLPSVNNLGEVLFTALRSDLSDTAGGKLSLSDWQIYIISNDGKERELATGQYPKWLDDTHFVFANKDGISTQDIDGVAKQIIPFVGYYGVNNMKMSTSDDGTLLAWSIPDSGKVIIYSIDTGKKLFTLNTTAFWSAFSPDNKYLAVQAIDDKNALSNPKPHIEIYSLTDYSLQYTIGLDSFIQTSMFLTDWTM